PVGVAAGATPSDRPEGGAGRTLSIRHFQQLDRRDPPQGHQDEERPSIRLHLDEARRPPGGPVPRPPPAVRPPVTPVGHTVSPHGPGFPRTGSSDTSALRPCPRRRS